MVMERRCGLIRVSSLKDSGTMSLKLFVAINPVIIGYFLYILYKEALCTLNAMLKKKIPCK